MKSSLLKDGRAMNNIPVKGNVGNGISYINKIKILKNIAIVNVENEICRK